MKKVLKMVLSIIEGLLTATVAVPVFIYKATVSIMKVIIHIAIIIGFSMGVLYLLENEPVLFPWLMIGFALFFVSACILAFWKEKKFYKIFGISNKKD